MEPVAGIEAMVKSRGIVIAKESDLKRVSSGPGRMAEALGITRERDTERISPARNRICNWLTTAIACTAS